MQLLPGAVITSHAGRCSTVSLSLRFVDTEGHDTYTSKWNGGSDETQTRLIWLFHIAISRNWYIVYIKSLFDISTAILTMMMSTPSHLVPFPIYGYISRMFTTNILYAFLSHSGNMPCLFHAPWLYCSNNICRRVRIMNIVSQHPVARLYIHSVSQIVQSFVQRLLQSKFML
jgi:hypothetical protein